MVAARGLLFVPDASLAAGAVDRRNEVNVRTTIIAPDAMITVTDTGSFGGRHRGYGEDRFWYTDHYCDSGHYALAFACLVLRDAEAVAVCYSALVDEPLSDFDLDAIDKFIVAVNKEWEMR